MRIKCPHCGGKGFSEINSAVNMTCGWCMGQGELDIEVIPAKEDMTNEEWLRSATFEELAGAIYEWHSAGYTSGRVGLGLNPITEVVEWLKQPHNSSK